MKKSVVRWCVGAFAALLALMPVSSVFAQSGDTAPAMVVTIGPSDSLIKDIGYLTKVAGQPQAGGFLQIMAGQYLAPLDRSRPAGMYMSLDTGMPVPAAFIPVEDFDGFVSMIAEQVGADPEVDGGTTVIPMNGGQDLLLVQKGEWTYVTTDPSALDNLPNDPVSMMEGLEDYDLAVRVFGQNIPGDMKQMAIGAMREGFEQMLQQLPPDQAFAQRQMQERNLENLASMIEEMDALTIGLNVSQEQKEIHLDFIVTGLDGSTIAESSTRQAGARSNFLGFLNDEAAVNFNIISLLGDDEILQAKETFGSLIASSYAQMEDSGEMSDDELGIAKGILDTLESALEATLDTGKMDFGMQVIAAEDRLAVAGGFYMLQTDKIEAKVKELIALARQEAPPGTEFNLDVKKENGINWHEIVFPIPADNDAAYNLFGDTASVWLGVADEALYVAFGKESDKLVTEAIQESRSAQQEEGRTIEANFHVGRLMQLAGSGDPSAAMMADMMDGKKALMSVQGEMIENGSRSRLIIHEDLLKSLGQIGAQMGGAQF